MKAIIAVLVAVSLGAVGLGIVAVSEHRTIQELERGQEQASTEIEELSSEMTSLDNAPDPTDYAADIAALQDSLDKLDDKVFRIDMRTTGLPQLVDDNYAWFEGCIDDLLALQNNNPLSGNGLVC